MDTKETVIKFIYNKIGVEVTEQSHLFTDLNLIGLDADLFLEEFTKEFNVDFSAFEYKDYFHEISSIPFYHLLLKRIIPKKSRKKEFHLSHLIKVIEKGYWFNPSE